MNKEFFKPFILIAIATLLAVAIGLLIPACDNSVFPLRKMDWLRVFKHKIVKADSVAVEVDRVDHDQRALEPFLEKLGSLKPLAGQEALVHSGLFSHKDENVRIAYFGDSIIEGDLIVAPLRQTFQSHYGGVGVGMMPITSIVSGFRQTIKHTFSKNWEAISFMTSGKSDVPLGITGFTFIPRNYYVAVKTVEPVIADSLLYADTLATAPPELPKPESTRYYVDYNPWVEYAAVNIPGGAASFDKIRLFYSKANAASWVKVSIDGAAATEYWLSSGENLNTLDLSGSAPIKKIKLEFSANDPIHVYGVSFDSSKGVFVDNFPIRGYSGMYFQRIEANLLKGFQKHLDYDLIILQYGENVSNAQNRDYTNYKNAMKRTVLHLQQALPKVPILIVSAHDRSIKTGTEYATSPDIPILVKAQSQLALETNSAFWNLFEAMGGYNSMLGFVNSKPALAGKDYTHFTRRGADKVANLLLEFLIKG